MKTEFFSMAIVFILIWLFTTAWAYYAPPSGRLINRVVFGSALFGPIWIPFALFFYKRYLVKNWDRG